MNRISYHSKSDKWHIEPKKSKTIAAESVKEALLYQAFFKHVRQEFGDAFTITGVQKIADRQVYQLKVNDNQGHEYDFEISPMDLTKDLNLNKSNAIAFPHQPDHGYYEDGFSLAATTYFETYEEKESKIPKTLRAFSPQSRIVVEGDNENPIKKVILTRRGLSRIERVFFRIFKPDRYNEWAEQNKKTIEAYKDFLIRECGAEKVEQIEKTFGFDLDQMKKDRLPLLPIYVYYFNIGMNNIEFTDIEQFAEKIKFASSMKDFTQRELRGLNKLGIKDIGDLHKHFSIPDRDDYADDLDVKTFGNLVDALMTPLENEEDWDKVYTGRKFSAAIQGSYNTEVGTTKKFRPWIDMQELAQTHWKMRKGTTGDSKTVERIFYEDLVKIAVKKHLMRSSNDRKWRVGALLPSPYKDNGKTVWYRVEEGVDSGYGKYWLVLKPANPHYDSKLPIIRVHRDTCPSHYAQRAGPTIIRDVAKDPGYMYSHTTEKEDAAFFKSFTLPIWMAHIAVTFRQFDPKDPGKKIFKEALEKVYKTKELSTDNLNRYLSKPNLENAKECLLELMHSLDSNSPDTKLMWAVINGNPPRPLSTIGTSLGGFDAQHTLVKNTAESGRVPVVLLTLYTHSTLKIGDEDNNTFVQFMNEHQELMKGLGSFVSFDHIVDKDDPVPQFGADRTFLGKGLTENFSFRAYEVIEGSQHSEIKEVSQHVRRMEYLEVGTDIQLFTDSVKEYEKHSSEQRVWKFSIDSVHNFANTLGLTYIFRKFMENYRQYIKQGMGMSLHERHKLLHVTLEGHQFKLVNPRNSPTRPRSRS